MELPTEPDKRNIVNAFMRFMSSRGKGKGCILSSDDMQALMGTPRLDIRDHDIYVMGRGPNNEPLWSIIRVLSNTTAENKIQGKLAVRFMHGYGKQEAGSDKLRLVFPEGIRRLTTKDSVGFKHRSAFYLHGKFYRLTHVEHLCNIDVMRSADQLKYQSTVSIKKAQSYSMQRAMKREWAHTSRERCRNDQKKKMLKMMIPYWNNATDFYETFMADIKAACESAKESLGPVEVDLARTSRIKIDKEKVDSQRSTEARPSKSTGLVVW